MTALILYGDVDTTVDIGEAHTLAGTLPNDRLITYVGARHNFIVGYPEKSNEDVLAFLNEAELSEPTPSTP